ncbi:hypothetical protein K439DRAFT_1664929 [Ramaria rubella]|nr:hypothetical protein K439DRAFT_1664929 [Ramaria rubella]
MSLDISRRIRAALGSDSPTKNLSEVLNAIDVFVHQQKEIDLAVLDQLCGELEDMYKELVDHSSPANVETFVSILHGFLPLFPPIYVITCWWDLVLRAALRDTRLSAKALQQVKVITLHGLIPDSPKAFEYGKRIVQLFLLDAYDESSGRDALEHATMTSEERQIQHLWKHNLGGILEEFCIKRPHDFLNTIESFFKIARDRLKLSLLLSTLVRSPEFHVQEFAVHVILDSFLLSLVVDGSSTLFESEITTLATLLPQFAMRAPEALVRILPYCYAILARVVCWKLRPQTRELLERDFDNSETSSQSRLSDQELDAAQTSKIRSDLQWERLESTFSSSVSNIPCPLPLFRTLYGLYPCNTLAFLRNPVEYLNKSGLKSPFETDWLDIIDEDQIRTRSRALLRHHILHSSLLVHTVESELEEPNRWEGWDLSRIVMMCTMLDVRNAALSLHEATHLSDEAGFARTPLISRYLGWPQSSPDDAPQSEDNMVMELKGVDFSASGRPRVSVQDILATYHVLKSGVEIDIVDPIPAWPHILFPATATSSYVTTAAAASSSRNSLPTASDEPLPPHVEEAISGLQRENLLLHTELNYELWLKRENVKRIGQLYEDRILVKGAEVERQGLHNKLREYKGQVQRLQDALTKEQASATALKSQHGDYTRRLQARLKAEKAEKQSWADEKAKLNSAYEDAKAMLEAQAVRLADATELVFKLETEIKEDAPKVQRLRDYEDKIDQLTKTQQLWDRDVHRFKEQEAYLEDLRSRYRKKLLLIESYEQANQGLEETINSLQSRISALELQTMEQRPPPEPSPTVFRMMEALREQVSKLTSERDGLLHKNDELEDQTETLRAALEALQGANTSH